MGKKVKLFFMFFEKAVLGSEESFFHELASGKMIPRTLKLISRK